MSADQSAASGATGGSRALRADVVVLAAVSALLAAPVAHAQEEGADLLLPMSDGIQLSTDVSVPGHVDPAPAILLRTPYGTNGGTLVVQGLIALAGVATVFQDLRGTGLSEGSEGLILSQESSDGADTAAWILGTSWSDGRIVLEGNSALGYAAHMAAASGAPGIIGAQITFAPHSSYDIAWRGGSFRERLAASWVLLLADGDDLEQLQSRPYWDADWAAGSSEGQYAQIDAMGLHVVGWYDVFAASGLKAWQGWQHEGGPGALGQQKLIIGPWAHDGLRVVEQGELTFPDASTTPPGYASVPVDGGTHVVAQALYGAPTGNPAWTDLATVTWWRTGDLDDPAAPGNDWVTDDDWPPEAGAVRMHLQPGGGLSEECPAVDGGSTDYLYDPLDPSPSRCGAVVALDDDIISGPCDLRTVDGRADNIVFETGILEEPVEVTGPLSAHLVVSIDQPDTDLFVRVTDVYPDGRAIWAAEGSLRLATRGSRGGLWPLSEGEVVDADIDLGATSLVFNTGHRIRITVTSSSAPEFTPNRNNGLDYLDMVAGPAQPVTVSLHHALGAASFVSLPMPERPDAQPPDCDSPGDDDDSGPVADDDDSGSDDKDSGSDDDDSAAPSAEEDPADPVETGNCACPGGGASVALPVLAPIALLRRRSRQ